MNIKEFFEIEPTQKNGLIILVLAFVISYLQLFLFKHNFIDLTQFDKIILSLSVSVFWAISEIPTYHFAMKSKWKKLEKESVKAVFILDKFIIAYGFTLLFWMSIITYIGYEFEMDLLLFIRTSIIAMFSKSLFWYFYYLKYKYIDSKKKQH